MTKEQALTLALEALEQIDPYVDQLIDYSSTAAEYPLNNAPRNVVKAITAIKEALAQPERTGWPAGLLQDDDRKLSKWLASKPGAKHVVDMAQPEQRLKQVAHVYLLDAKGWPKVGWDDGRGIKVGDKLYIITEST